MTVASRYAINHELIDISSIKNERKEPMKAIALVVGVTVLLAGLGCNRPANDTAAANVATLQAKIEKLEKANSDLAFKGRLTAQHLFGSPLENFFGSDEFWENPYDSGQADCARRCVATLTSERKICDAIPDCTRRQQCFQDVIQRASACQTQCSANHQPQI
jgi:outer membrane murein-binding lipoprotein Lpp